MPPLLAPPVIAPLPPELLLMLPPIPEPATPTLPLPPAPTDGELPPLALEPLLPVAVVPALGALPATIPLPETAPDPPGDGSSLLQPPARSRTANDAIPNAQMPKRGEGRDVAVKVFCILPEGLGGERAPNSASMGNGARATDHPGSLRLTSAVAHAPVNPESIDKKFAHPFVLAAFFPR
jgi:hypothetical protein